MPNYTLSLQFSGPEIDVVRSNKNVVFYLEVKAEMMSSLAPVHWRHFTALFPQSAHTPLFPSWQMRERYEIRTKEGDKFKKATTAAGRDTP